jgi:hypothetical protein
LEDPGVDEGKTLRWVFRKWDVGAWIGLIWLRKFFFASAIEMFPTSDVST